MTTINENLAIFAVLSIADNIRTRRKLRRLINDYRAHHQMGVEIVMSQQAQIQYLCDLIDKKDVELTEIEMLELTYLLP